MEKPGHCVIGVQIGATDNPFFADFVNAVHQKAVNHGYSVVAGLFDVYAVGRTCKLQSLNAVGVDGIIGFGHTLEQQTMRRNNPPVVSIDNEASLTQPWSVGIDFKPGVTQAADHFVDSGRQHILTVCHAVEDITVDRMASFINRLAERGIDPNGVGRIPAVPSVAGGVKAAKEILASGDKVDAIFCYNDAVGLGLLHELVRQGVMVPFEIALVGCDNLPLSSLVTPRLSTVSFGLDRLAQATVEMLIQRIDGAQDIGPIRLDTCLIVRESSDSGLAEINDRRGLNAWRTGGIVHDFNNTLAVLKGTAELLAHELTDQPRSRRLVDRLEASIQRAEILTGQLKANIGHRSPATVIDIDEFLTSIVGDLRQLLKPDLDVIYRPAPGRLHCLVERNLLASTFTNLALNARSAAEKGTITISVDTTDKPVQPSSDIDDQYVTNRAHFLAPSPTRRHIIIDVADDGPGVPPILGKRIFEPFFTGSGTGTGLGLAVSRAFLRDADGDLCLIPTERGATFRISLPLTDDEPDVTEEVKRPVSDGAMSIAILDDESLVGSTISDMFESLGHRCELFTRTTEAIEAAGSGRHYDLLVADMMLPDGSGLDVAKHFRTLNAAKAIAIVSGLGDILDRDTVDDNTIVMSKPIGFKELSKIINHAQRVNEIESESSPSR